MNFGNFFKKIISGFKEPCDDSLFDNGKTKILNPLKMDFFFPSLLDYNSEEYFRNREHLISPKNYLFLKKGMSIKEIQPLHAVYFDDLVDAKLNLCEVCIYDHLDYKFIVKSWYLKFTNEKFFKIEIGKLKDRPILYMN